MPSNRQAKVASAYAIFEGGGAKGIAHAGALKAFEESGKAVVGVAGTSAGAIMAALVAVGYSSDEIYSDSGKNILSDLGYESPISVIGQGDWRRLSKLIRSYKAPLYWLLLGQAICGVSLLISMFGILIVAPWYLLSIPAALGLTISVSSFTVLAWRGWPVLRTGGMFSTERISNLVNEALRRKLREHYLSLGLEKEVPERVLFRHIDPAVIEKCIPLKIVVTNVTKGELTLFDRRNPDVCVADVVAASAGLPLAFKPAAIPSYASVENCTFTDGGLVSNLPSWVFKDEKRQRERLETSKGGVGSVPIYAFSLSSPKTRYDVLLSTSKAGIWGDIKKSIGHFNQVLQTGIFGSQAVVGEFVPDLKVISIQCELDTIDFDCTAERADQAYLDGYDSVRQFLEKEAFRAELTEEALDFIHSQVEAKIHSRRARRKPTLRLALIDPIRGDSLDDLIGFQVTVGANMDEDADDRLELDSESSIAAQAFKNREVFYGEVKGENARTLRMTKYEHALLPKDLASVIAIPIFARSPTEGNPQRVLAIDSTDKLSVEYRDKRFISEIQRLSVTLSHPLIEQTVNYAMEDG